MPTEEMVVDVSQDWALACDVQQGFMLAPCPPNNSFDYAGRCRQNRALGGDCFGFMPLKDDQLAWVVGDASGKGLAAALMIANVQSCLRTAALFAGEDLAALFKVVNQLAYSSSLADRFATLFYGVFDNAKRKLRYVNAGQNSPVVLRRHGSLEWLETSGAPVGMFPDSSYEERVVEVEAGDLVIAYTDGVVEAMNHKGEEWGVQRLLKAAVHGVPSAQKAAVLIDVIFDSLDDFSQGHQTDDATLAVVRVI